MLSARALRELRAWTALAATSAAGYLVAALPDMVALFFLGRLGVTTLASVSLAGTYAYSICDMLWIGLALGHGALAAQATGSYSYTGLYGWTLQWLVAGALAAALLLPVFLTGHLVIGALAPPGIDLAQVREYLWWSAPVALLVPVYDAACGHLTAIQRLAPVLAIAVGAAAVNVGACWGLVLGAGLGGKGAALANVASCAVGAVAGSAAFARLSMPPAPEEGEGEEEEEEEEEGEEGEEGAGEGRAGAVTEEQAALDAGDGGQLQLQLEARLLSGRSSSSSSSISAPAPLRHARAVAAVTWRAVRRFAMDGSHVRTFLSQSGAATLSMALEIGTDLALTFFAARLGAVEAAVNNSLEVLFQVLVTLCIGAFEATSIRVGGALGRGRVAGAARVGWVGGAVLAAWAAGAAGALLAARGALGRAFSDDARVVAGIAGLAPWLALRHAALVAYIHLCSILDGQGRAELYVALSCVVLAVALPLGWASAGWGWGLPGLWGASAAGYGVAAALAAGLLARSDWRALSRLAVERSRAEEEEGEEGEGGEQGGTDAGARGEGLGDKGTGGT